MSAPMNFRSAFNGFNREDVAHFIEYLNARHSAEMNQLKAELDLLRSRSAAPAEDRSEELAAALAEIETLKAELAQLRQRRGETETAPAAPSGTAQELEAYRRAERTERVARERAEQIYHQVNGVLADATVKVEEASIQLGDMSEQFLARLETLRAAVAGSKEALSGAAQTLYAIRPESEE